MDANVFAGKWKQMKGEVKTRWAELTDSDVEKINGDWVRFVGTLQEKYGKSKEQVTQEAKDFFNNLT